MASAVTAVRAGCDDPIGFLSTPFENGQWDAACVVWEKVAIGRVDDRRDEFKAIVKAIGVEVGNAVATQLARMF